MRTRILLLFVCLLIVLTIGCAKDTTHHEAAADDDIVDDDAIDDDVTDDDSIDDDTTDDDAVDDDAVDDDLFPPDEQTPLYEKGLILPPNSLECVPVGGAPQLNCNHHGSTVAELPDGTVAAVWYHGVTEGSPDARIVWSQLAPGAAEWSWPEVLYDDPDHSEGNPALWVEEDGTLFVFFVSIFGDGWSQSKIRLVRSTDNGQSWSDPIMLREDYCWMTRHRPLRLADGDLLLPLYSECLADPVFMRSKDNFETWTEEPHLNLRYYLQHPGQIQPALALLDGGRIAAITRDGWPTHRIKRMVSDDNGYTWTASRMTSLPNSGTSVDQVRLLDGHVVVAFNNSPTDRFPLSAALSLDGGETFTAIRDINDECDEGSCSYPYPSIMQSRHDGTIWVTYTYNRETIGWVHFNEAWLMEQADLW